LSSENPREIMLSDSISRASISSRIVLRFD
jgi:hypothetical protein